MGLKELFFGKARDKPTNSTPGSAYRFFLGGTTAEKRVTEHSAMQGFHNGKAVNTLAPFGAACHSIVYAAEQIDKEEYMKKPVG